MTELLEFLVKALVNEKKIAEADKALARLKEINPQNGSMSELQDEITQARAGNK